MDPDFLKGHRVISTLHLVFIRSLPCIVCGYGADAHHLDSRGSGGSDYSAIPLCRSHHSEIHQIGKTQFNQKYNLDVWRECWQIICRVQGLHQTEAL